MNNKWFASSSDVVAVVFLGLGLRAMVSLNSYSGKGNRPMYGDYEAQRHWQEITINLPIQNWYTNSSKNDLMYWGLDYPPLTAYHSYAMGLLAKMIDEDFVALESSRGYESKAHKSFMRLTVLIADALIYIPSIVVLGFALQTTFQKNIGIAFIALMSIYPGQILIDNGHFQYNNVSLGLAALALACLLKNSDYSAAFLFSLALNYKQMELYHALPFFFCLLQRCLYGAGSVGQKVHKFCIISGIVVLTFATLWIPWLQSMDNFLNFIRRLFPVSRGVFEDKVANFWCAFNVIYKLKKKFSNGQMALICLGTTATLVMPQNIRLFLSHSKKELLFAVTYTALCFFLFSFQVHEKSILLVTLPASCIIAFEPMLTYHMLQVATFSMLPLFIKDQLAVPYFALFLLFIIYIRLCCDSLELNCKLISRLNNINILIVCLLSVASIFAPSPSKLPFFWPLIVSLYSFLNLMLNLLFGLYLQSQ